MRSSKITCLVADDEPLARMGLKKYIADQPDLDLVGECKNGEEVLQRLKENKVDLLFLDIEMPFLNGWQVIDNLEERPLVVITTAYGQHALKGFEVNVVDYLVKPFSKSRFRKAIDRVSELFSLHALRDNEQILIKSNRVLYKLPLSDITVLQAMENYVVFHTSDKKYIVHQTLNSAIEMLKSIEFYQVHKSFVINSRHIQSVAAQSVTVNGQVIPIGKSYKKELAQKLNRLIN